MMEVTGKLLADLGLPAARLFVERFGSPRPLDLGERKVFRLRVDGRDVPAPSDQTLLESATAAGLAMPFSCTMGGCGACKRRLVAGEVSLEEPNCLSDAERADGHVLTCVAHPRSDVALSPPLAPEVSHG
jgi:ferredoxin